jgi:hypothetical protein
MPSSTHSPRFRRPAERKSTPSEEALKQKRRREREAAEERRRRREQQREPARSRDRGATDYPLRLAKLSGGLEQVVEGAVTGGDAGHVHTLLRVDARKLSPS